MDDKQFIFLIQELETGELQHWTLNGIIDHINASHDSSKEYDKNNWWEGWYRICEKTHYSLRGVIIADIPS